MGSKFVEWLHSDLPLAPEKTAAAPAGDGLNDWQRTFSGRELSQLDYALWREVLVEMVRSQGWDQADRVKLGEALATRDAGFYWCLMQHALLLELPITRRLEFWQLVHQGKPVALVRDHLRGVTLCYVLDSTKEGVGMYDGAVFDLNVNGA